MTFFVDANVIVYGAVDGPARDNCVRALEAIAAGEVEGRTSTAVLEEVWHVARRRYPGQLDELVQSALDVFSPLLPVTEEGFVIALGLGESSLDPNDRLQVGTCLSNQINVVLTADRAFDEALGIKRVDPFDAEAVEALLAASPS